MLFRPLYVPIWDLNRPGGNRQGRVVLIRGQGRCLDCGLGSSSAGLGDKRTQSSHLPTCELHLGPGHRD